MHLLPAVLTLIHQHRSWFLFFACAQGQTIISTVHQIGRVTFEAAPPQLFEKDTLAATRTHEILVGRRCFYYLLGSLLLINIVRDIGSCLHSITSSLFIGSAGYLSKQHRHSVTTQKHHRELDLARQQLPVRPPPRVNTCSLTHCSPLEVSIVRDIGLLARSQPHSNNVPQIGRVSFETARRRLERLEIQLRGS